MKKIREKLIHLLGGYTTEELNIKSYNEGCLEGMKAIPDGSYDKVITMKVNYCEENDRGVRYNPTPRNVRYKVNK